MAFGESIEEVEIKTDKVKVDMVGVGGPSLKKMTIEVKGIKVHNLCDVIAGTSEGTTFEVKLENTVAELSQNQRCSGGQGKRKIALHVSNSILVSRHVGNC